MTDISGQRVVIVGGGSRLGRAIALAASRAGAEIVVAGRKADLLREVADLAVGPAEAMLVDLTQPETIARLGLEIGPFDHLISTVSMHAGGPVVELEDAAIQNAIDAKIIGPLRLVRATTDSVRPGGSFTFFSGQRAWRPAAGSAVTSIVNGGLAFLVRALAVELAPLRFNAISPGTIDSGGLDHLGDRKAEVLEERAKSIPVGRVGIPEDIVAGTLMVLGNGFMTGTVVHIDGGSTA